MKKQTIYKIAALGAVILFFLKAKSNSKTLNSSSMSPTQQNKNLDSFLHVIRTAERTAVPNGYRTIFGGKLFTDFSKHPNIKVPFHDKAIGKTNYSTAAGAYQFLYSTWENCRKKLNLPDFSPASQDKAARMLISGRGALNDVLLGNFAEAISKVRKEWASMPNAGYSQPEKTLAQVTKWYKDAGGVIA